LVLLFDAGVAVAVAVEEVTGTGTGPRSSVTAVTPSWSIFVLGEVAATDVGRCVAEVVKSCSSRRGSRLGVLIGTIQDEVSDIEVTLLEGEFAEAQHFVGDVGEDGVAVFEEGVEGAAEAVVVEFVGGNVPEVFDAVFAAQSATLTRAVASAGGRRGGWRGRCRGRNSASVGRWRSIQAATLSCSAAVATRMPRPVDLVLQ